MKTGRRIYAETRGRPTLTGRPGKTRGPEIPMPPALRERATARAAAEGMALATWVRGLIERELGG